jgi:hypothetical protein
MNNLILNALIYGAVLSVVLVIIMVTSATIAPDMWVGDYPPDIKEKYGPMSEKARKVRPYIAIVFFTAMLLFPILALFRLEAQSAVPVNLGSAFLTSFLIFLVFNLFDLLILDWLLFATLHPKTMVLPGTEGMAGYSDYRFHFVGFLKGLGFCLFGGLLVAVIWQTIQLID